MKTPWQEVSDNQFKGSLGRLIILYSPYLYHGHLIFLYINLNISCLHRNVDSCILPIGWSGALRGLIQHLVVSGEHHTQGEEYLWQIKE